MVPQLGLVKAPAPLFRPEFWGAADQVLGRDFDSRELLTIEPYDVDVLSQERTRSDSPHWCGAVASQLRDIDCYLDDVRRAA